MVYYMTHNTVGVRLPPVPPVCPKCGSHRTQIIGTFGEANTLNIRCATCGEVSTVPVPQAESQRHTSTTEPAEQFEEQLQQAIVVAVRR